MLIWGLWGDQSAFPNFQIPKLHFFQDFSHSRMALCFELCKRVCENKNLNESFPYNCNCCKSDIAIPTQVKKDFFHVDN